MPSAGVEQSLEYGSPVPRSANRRRDGLSPADGEAPVNGWQAMACGPRRFLTSSWPWRSLCYLVCSALVAVLILMLMEEWLTVIDTVPAYLRVVLGVLATDAVVAVPLAILERRRLRIMDAEPATNPHAPLAVPGPRNWLWTRLSEAATWRELGYAIAFTVVLPFLGLAGVILAGIALVLPVSPLLELIPGVEPLVIMDWQVAGPVDKVMVVLLGLALLPAAAYLVTVLAAGQAVFARLLLTPREAELAARVQELTRSRTRLVDAFEAERRRIERDLHDGAQQRLVALTMTLGVAELELSEAEVRGEGPQLVAKARWEAEAVLAELRELIRGIHPQVLTDRGIAAAVAEIADRCPMPVSAHIAVPERLAPVVEAVAYFTVSEGLANVVKHSGAGRAEVTGRRVGDRLVLRVVDDGVGGANPDGGTGLQGLADRVAVVSGRLMLLSPYGGPTELLVELPWRTPDSA